MLRGDTLRANSQTGNMVDGQLLDVTGAPEHTSPIGEGPTILNHTEGIALATSTGATAELETRQGETSFGFIRSAFDSASEYLHQLPAYRKVVAGISAAGLAVAGTAGAASVAYHPRSNAYVNKHCKDLAVANPQNAKNRVQDGIHVWFDSGKKGKSQPRFSYKLLKGQDICVVKFDRMDGKTVKPQPDRFTKSSGVFNAPPGNSREAYTTMYVYAER